MFISPFIDSQHGHHSRLRIRLVGKGLRLNTASTLSLQRRVTYLHQFRTSFSLRTLGRLKHETSPLLSHLAACALKRALGIPQEKILPGKGEIVISETTSVLLVRSGMRLCSLMSQFAHA